MGKKRQLGLYNNVKIKLGKWATKQRIVAIIVILIIIRITIFSSSEPSSRECKTYKRAPVKYTTQDDNTLKERQNKIKESFQHAWKSYKKYAYGHDELKPISKSNHNWIGMGLSIVDTIDTMYMMGLTDEYNEAKDWIEDNLQFEKMTQHVSLFETTIRVVGGLLSVYQLTNEFLFLERAHDLGKRLVRAFDTETGIPHHTVRVHDGSPMSTFFDREVIFLSEAGSLQMEYLTLSHETNIPEYGEKAMKVFEILNEMEKHNGLYPILINPITGKFQKEETWRERWIWGAKKDYYYTLGGKADSFYEYLLKVWILTGKTDEQTRKMYEESTQAILDQLQFTTPKSGLLYFGEKEGDKIIHEMEHLACFLGGMFALVENESEHMRVGEKVTETCHETYFRTVTGIAADRVSFPDSETDMCPIGLNYYLRPETVESYYILYWITGDAKYQEWGWEAFEAIEKYCKTPFGYSGIEDVTNKESKHDDLQQSFHMAETLKYLYLLFSPPSSRKDILSLDDWVFNTEAHPFRVWNNKNK